MPRLNLPLGLEGSRNLPRTRRDLVNCFNNGSDNILPRRGIEDISTSTGIARGQFVWNGSLYQVRSSNLVKVNENTGAETLIGTVEGTNVIHFAIGFNTATFIVQNATGKLYTLDKSDVLTDISGNANILPCRDITHIDNRFVYIPFDGSPAFFSDVGAAGTVQALSFFDAEELPDENRATFNAKNTLVIMGTDSGQYYLNKGISPVPFVRIDRSRIPYGFIGGLLEYIDDQFLFIGREKDQDRGIYLIKQGSTAKISNERIDAILSTYTDDELSNAISGRFKMDGYDIATFTLSADSFAFFGGNWFTLSSFSSTSMIHSGVIPHQDTLGPWLAGFITQFEGTYYTAQSTHFGKFAKINTDYGERIVRIIDTAFEQEDSNFFACQSMELVVSQGVNLELGSIAILMSRNNVQYGPAVFRELGEIGQYHNRLVWNPPGGLGMYEGFVGVRFYTADNVDFSIDYGIYKIR